MNSRSSELKVGITPGSELTEPDYTSVHRTQIAAQLQQKFNEVDTRIGRKIGYDGFIVDAVRRWLKNPDKSPLPPILEKQMTTRFIDKSQYFCFTAHGPNLDIEYIIDPDGNPQIKLYADRERNGWNKQRDLHYLTLFTGPNGVDFRGCQIRKDLQRQEGLVEDTNIPNFQTDSWMYDLFTSSDAANSSEIPLVVHRDHRASVYTVTYPRIDRNGMCLLIPGSTHIELALVHGMDGELRGTLRDNQTISWIDNRSVRGQSMSKRFNDPAEPTFEFSPAEKRYKLQFGHYGTTVFPGTINLFELLQNWDKPVELE